MHKDHCKLNWDKPKDDGGLPLSAYVVEKMDTTTGRWVPVGRVPGDTTEMEVKGLEPGKRYDFRVKAVNEEGESEPLDTDHSTLAKDPYGTSAQTALSGGCSSSLCELTHDSVLSKVKGFYIYRV